MKVLFFYQHFWPDSPPYASMLRTIGAGLAVEGFEVQVLCGQPAYKDEDLDSASPVTEVIDGVYVRRLSSIPGIKISALLRRLQKVIFPVRAFFTVVRLRLVGKAPDVIVAATIPPVLNGFFASLAARIAGASFVYHMQDIYPEIGSVSGLWKRDSAVHKILLALDKWNCRGADVCLVLSEDMRNSLMERGFSGEKITVINNFQLEVVEETDVGYDPVVIPPRSVVFAGNLGRFQGLDLLVKGFIAWDSMTQSEQDGEKLSLHFLGDGAMKSELVKLANLHPRIIFHGHLPFSKAVTVIEQFDAGVVSVSPSIYKYAYPSKTLTYLGLGVPVFALVETESKLAELLLENNLGVVCVSRNLDGVVTGFNELSSRISESTFSSCEIKNFNASNLSAAAMVGKWKQLISVLGK